MCTTKIVPLVSISISEREGLIRQFLREDVMQESVIYQDILQTQELIRQFLSLLLLSEL
ncbi:MAG: hypothetical protein V7K47_26740 [Nostoc sp.]